MPLNLGLMIKIIGTAHVSRRSVEEVERVIEEIKPKAVALELCYKRFLALTQNRMQEIRIFDVIKKGDLFLFLFQIILSYYQRKIGKELNVRPGEEMLAAIKKAKEIGADILLIDRDISITFKRFWQSLRFLEKLKITLHLMRSIFKRDDIEVDRFLEEDLIDRIVREFREFAPNASKVLIDERDAYMAYNLINAQKKYDSIVAIVGAGHKRGIEYFLKNPEKLPSISELTSVKERRFDVFKAIGFTLTSLIAVTFAYILLNLGSEMALKAFMYWFLINGILSAVGALIARAHPLSVLSAFLCAWLTSLSPLIAAGWISGFVEVKMRKPTSKDFDLLVRAENLRELLNNKVFRILLVAAMTNIGSMIGTFYGIYYVMSMTGIDIREVILRMFGGFFS